MKKFDWNLPMTRKDYAVLCGLIYVISMLIYGIIIARYYWDDIKTWTKRTIEKIKSKLPWCD